MAEETSPTEMTRRAGDNGWVCWLAVRAADFWDFVDKRNVDLHVVLGITLWLTIEAVHWAMDFADGHPEYTEAKVAMIIAAVLGPWGLMQAAMFGFYANARKRT